MPNTKSAEKRVRSTAAKTARNKAVKSRLKTLETKFLKLVQSKQPDQAAEAYRRAEAAYDKAAKVGAIHKAKADRKKSRLALKLKAAQA